MRQRVFLGHSKPTRQWDIAIFLLSNPRLPSVDWFEWSKRRLDFFKRDAV